MKCYEIPCPICERGSRPCLTNEPMFQILRRLENVHVDELENRFRANCPNHPDIPIPDSLRLGTREDGCVVVEATCGCSLFNVMVALNLDVADCIPLGHWAWQEEGIVGPDVDLFDLPELIPTEVIGATVS